MRHMVASGRSARSLKCLGGIWKQDVIRAVHRLGAIFEPKTTQSPVVIDSCPQAILFASHQMFDRKQMFVEPRCGISSQHRSATDYCRIRGAISGSAKSWSGGDVGLARLSDPGGLCFLEVSIRGPARSRDGQHESGGVERREIARYPCSGPSRRTPPRCSYAIVEAS
jgi:hypothetical protein